MTQSKQQAARQDLAQKLSKRLYEQHPLPGACLDSRVFFSPSFSEPRLYHVTVWKDNIGIIFCDCLGWVSIQHARRNNPEKTYDDCVHGMAVKIAIAEEQERRNQHALFNPDYMQDF
jgi:hypothetical protein